MGGRHHVFARARSSGPCTPDAQRVPGAGWDEFTLLWNRGGRSCVLIIRFHRAESPHSQQVHLTELHHFHVFTKCRVFPSELEGPHGPPGVPNSGWFPAKLLSCTRGLGLPDLQAYLTGSPGEGGRGPQKGRLRGSSAVRAAVLASVISRQTSWGQLPRDAEPRSGSPKPLLAPLLPSPPSSSSLHPPFSLPAPCFPLPPDSPPSALYPQPLYLPFPPSSFPASAAPSTHLSGCPCKSLLRYPGERQ